MTGTELTLELFVLLYFPVKYLTLKAPITTAADDILKYFHCFFLVEIRLDVLSESSARQRIHLKYQALFSWKDKSEKLKCRLQQFLFSALRVKLDFKPYLTNLITKIKNTNLLTGLNC